MAAVLRIVPPYRPGRGRVKDRTGSEPGTRVCNLCGLAKSRSEFGSHSGSPDGLNGFCPHQMERNENVK